MSEPKIVAECQTCGTYTFMRPGAEGVTVPYGLPLYHAASFETCKALNHDVREVAKIVAECWTCADSQGRPQTFEDGDPWAVLALRNHRAAGHDVRPVIAPAEPKP